MNKTYPYAALASAFIPGLGQLMKGQVVLAGTVFFATLVSAVLVMFGIGILTTPVIYIWQIVDAYNNAVNN